MEKLIQMLKEIKSDIDYETVDDLVDSGVFASMDILRIVTMIEDEFDIKIPISKLRPQYFNSAKNIYDLIEQLQ